MATGNLGNLKKAEGPHSRAQQSKRTRQDTTGRNRAALSTDGWLHTMAWMGMTAAKAVCTEGAVMLVKTICGRPSGLLRPSERVLCSTSSPARRVAVTLSGRPRQPDGETKSNIPIIVLGLPTPYIASMATTYLITKSKFQPQHSLSMPPKMRR